MPDTPIAAQVHQALDVHRGFTTEVALYRERRDSASKFRHLGFRQVFHFCLLVDAGSCADLACACPSDAVDRRQCNDDVLVNRNIDSCYACHVTVPFELTLTLLVSRVGANHPNHPVATDDLAVPAHLLDRCSYFHQLVSVWPAGISAAVPHDRNFANSLSSSCPRTGGSWREPASAT